MSFNIIQCPQIIGLDRVNGIPFVNGSSSVGFGSGVINDIATYTGSVSAPFLQDSGIAAITDNVQGSFLDLNSSTSLKNFVYYDKVHNKTGIINATSNSNLVECGDGVDGIKVVINGDDGTDGQVLTSASGKVTWATPSGGSISTNSFYVNQTGDDGTGDGSLNAPWATIQHAVDQRIMTGGVINVTDAGVYDKLEIVNPLQKIYINAPYATIQPSGSPGDPGILIDISGGTQISILIGNINATVTGISIPNTGNPFITVNGFVNGSISNSGSQLTINAQQLFTDTIENTSAGSIVGSVGLLLCNNVTIGTGTITLLTTQSGLLSTGFATTLTPGVNVANPFAFLP